MKAKNIQNFLTLTALIIATTAGAISAHAYNRVPVTQAPPALIPMHQRGLSFTNPGNPGNVSSVLSNWEGEVALGITKLSGTTDEEGIKFDASALKAVKGQYESEFEVFSHYAKTDDTKSQDRRGINFRHQRTISGKMFWDTNTSLREDRIQKVTAEFQQTFGLGYKWLDGPRFELSTTPGLGYQFLDLTGTTPADSDREGSALLLTFAETFKWKIRDGLTFEQNFDFFAPSSDFSGYRIVFEAMLKTKLTDSFVLNVGYRVDYEGQPATGADSTQSLFSTSIGYTF